MKKSAAEKKVPAATARKAKAPTKGAAAKKQSIPNKDKAPKQPSTKGGRGGGGDKVVAKAYDKATHHASSGGAAKNEHLKVYCSTFFQVDGRPSNSPRPWVSPTSSIVFHHRTLSSILIVSAATTHPHTAHSIGEAHMHTA